MLLQPSIAYSEHLKLCAHVAVYRPMVNEITLYTIYYLRYLLSACIRLVSVCCVRINSTVQSNTSSHLHSVARVGVGAYVHTYVLVCVCCIYVERESKLSALNSAAHKNKPSSLKENTKNLQRQD